VGLTLCVPVLAVAQTDDQTKEIQERDRRYYERQAQAAEPAADPAQEEAEIRRRFLQEADAIVRDRNYSGRAGAHYRVQTDDPRLRAQVVVELLESFRSYFESFWSEDLKLLPYEDTGQVYLLYSYFKYNRLFTGKERFDESRSAGHYRAFFDVVVVHTDAVPGGLADVLVHEAAHQLVAQQLFGPAEATVAPWLNEGLASYFGFTFRAPDARFQPGVIGGKSVSLFPDGKHGQAGMGWERLQAFRKGWKKGERWPLGDLIAMEDRGLFYSENVTEHYAASWLLVHYLLHGEEGGHRDGFPRFLKHEAAGEGGAEGLYEDLGIGREDLERRYSDYVRSLKPNLRKRR
jgi:hypothetical protein